MAKLALIAQGQGASADPDIADDVAINGLVSHAVGDATNPLHGRDADEILAMLAARRGPERILDFMLRSGPYGDWFGERDSYVDPDGAEQPALSLALLEANPHGVDLGPLQPRLPGRAAHAVGEGRARALRAAGGRASGCAGRSTAIERARSCSSAAATSARTTRGCTTSTSS